MLLCVTSKLCYLFNFITCIKGSDNEMLCTDERHCLNSEQGRRSTPLTVNEVVLHGDSTMTDGPNTNGD